MSRGFHRVYACGMSDWAQERERLEVQYRQSLAAKDDEALIVSLNREARGRGWVSARGVYLQALRAEVGRRGWDLAAVDGLAHLAGSMHQFVLEKGRLLYAGETGTSDGDAAAVAGDPRPETLEVPAGIKPAARNGEDIRAAAERLGVDPAQYAAHTMLLSQVEAHAEMTRALAGRGQGPAGDVVYSVTEAGALVFVPLSRAKVLAEVVDAWWSSGTWGEVRERLERAGVAEEFLGRFGYPGGYPDDREELDEAEKEEATGTGRPGSMPNSWSGCPKT